MGNRQIRTAHLDRLAAGGVVKLDVEGVGEVELGADDVFITERPRQGWSVVEEDGQTIALDLELTPELVSAGLVREAIRFIQETRKASGLDVSDRIRLEWAADDPEMAKAVAGHLRQIADEVLATVTTQGAVGQGWVDDAETGLHVHVEKA